MVVEGGGGGRGGGELGERKGGSDQKGKKQYVFTNILCSCSIQNFKFLAQVVL